MKNKLKFLGIIAAVAVIGLSATGCDNGNGGGGFTLVVVNNYANPITALQVGEDPPLFSRDNLSIASGASQTFSFNPGQGMMTNIFLYAEGLSSGRAMGMASVFSGNTVTATLSAGGSITSEVSW